MNFRTIPLIFLMFNFFIGFVAVSTHSLADVQDLDDSMLNLLSKKPLNDPFPMVDPATNKPVSPDQIIKLPNGKTMKAGEYYQILNSYQSYLNKNGHTLKGSDHVGTLVETIRNVEQLRAKEEAQSKRIKDQDKAIMDTILDPDKLVDELTEAGKDEIRSQLRSLYLKALESGREAPLVRGRPPTPRVAIKQENNLQNITHKEWTLDLVNDKSFKVTGNATLNLGINLTELDGLAAARADAEILGQKVGLIDGKINGNAAFQKNSELEVRLSILKKDIFHRTWRQKEVLVKAKDDASMLQQTVRQGQKFRFSVGPVPVEGEIGAAGTIGYDWGAGIKESRGVVALNGFVQVDAFASVAAHVEIAQVGTVGNLTLLNETLKIQGEMGFDTDPSTGEPTLTTSVKGSNILEVLAGDLNVFVRAVVPTLGTPPFTEKEWSWEVFRWPGLKLGHHTEPKVLFNFRKVVDKNGYTLQLAPSPEDYDNLAVDRELAQVMASVAEELAQHEKSIVSVGDEALRSFVAVKDHFSEWVKSL